MKFIKKYKEKIEHLFLNRGSLFFMAFAGFVVSLSVLLILLSNQQKFLQSNFKLDTNRRIFALQKEIEYTKNVVTAFKAFYESSERVRRDEFKKFSQEILAGQQHIENLLWVPRVPKNWRKVYEDAAVKEGVSDFVFRAFNNENLLVESAEQESYYPIYFAESHSDSSGLLGFDLKQIKQLSNMLETAREKGEMSTTSWSSPDHEKDHGGFRIVVANPIYRNIGKSIPSENEFLGFVVATLRVDRLFDSALNMFTPQGIDIVFSEMSTLQQELKYYHYIGKLKQGNYTFDLGDFKSFSGLQTRDQIWIADKPWEVILYATSYYSISRYLWLPWALFLCGLVMTYLFCAFLWSVLKTKKTLQQLNASLKDEIIQRKRITKLVELSELRLRQIIDLVPHMIYAKDKTGRFLIVNEFAAKIYGKKVDELLGMKQRDIHYNKRQAEKYDNDDSLVLKNKKKLVIREELFESVDGQEQILETTKMPFFWDAAAGDVVLAISIDITDAKKTEALRSSEERFRGLVEKSHDAILLINERGVFIDANEKSVEILGYDREELYAMTLPDIDFAQSEAKFKLLWNDLKSGICIAKESFCRRKDKRFFPVEMRLSLITIRNVDYILLNLRDISKLKNMNQKLKETNTFLDSIIENLPNMIFIKDAKNLKFVRLNKAGEELLGLPEEALIGKDDYDFFPKEQADFFVAKDREVLSEGKLLDIPDEQVYTNDGTRYLHTKKIPIFNELGEACYLLGISEDVTEQKISRLDREQLHLAMENALDGIVKLGEDGKIVSANKSLTLLLDIKDKSIKNKNWRDFIHLQDQSQMKLLLEVASKKQKAEGEVRAVRNNGSVFHSQIVIIRNDNLFDEDCRHYCFIKDISEKKYHQAIEHKSELISMVSHELRTPIHSVREGVSVMLDGLTGEMTEEQKEILSTNLQSLDRLARLVNSFLDFQRLEAGVIEFKINRCQINELVKQSVREILPLANQKKLKMNQILDTKIPEVDCDSDRIIQVLTNLLANAVKFTSEGTIVIETQLTKDSKILITVTDTGVGIQSEDIPRLFKKFGQLESGKLLAPAGTGLGLAISKKIVEAHSGVLSAESEYQIGSKFSVLLPLSIENTTKVLERTS